MTAFTYQIAADLGPAQTGKTLEIRLRTAADAAVAFADGEYGKQGGEAGMTILERAGGVYTVNCTLWPYEDLPYTVVVYDAGTGNPIAGAQVEFNRQDFSDLAAGSGAVAWTYTLTNSVTALPIAGAQVWATTDAAGANLVASGTTDAFGQVVFFLDPGTYYIWSQRAGYTFNSPDQEIIV